MNAANLPKIEEDLAAVRAVAEEKQRGLAAPPAGWQPAEVDARLAAACREVHTTIGEPLHGDGWVTISASAQPLHAQHLPLAARPAEHCHCAGATGGACAWFWDKPAAQAGSEVQSARGARPNMQLACVYYLSHCTATCGTAPL